ncbi:MAG: indolepyruvate/phenylpyruvate decarboxylase [Rhodospirillaceae bacterium]|nr:indolepyruvate/phenylpyruvate decarboxylase [Rhodospirillaceae bacterium]
MKLAHALLTALSDYGAREVFGIPGDFALPFFKEVEASNILPLYTLSHEPAVGFAADATARFRSTLGVAAVTYGAGALNMVNAVATAYAEKSPLVVISGAPGAKEGAMGLGLHHQVKHLDSQRLVYHEITCAQAVLDDPARAPAEIARVLTAARETSRPVYIELPRDMVAAEVDAVPPFAPTPEDPEAARACAAEVMARLQAASAPALLLGVEVRRYGLEAKVEELARRLDLPTANTFMARGILADADVPLVGTYLGLAGEESVRGVIEGSDALLMLGVILCDTNFGTSQRQIDLRNAIHAFDRDVRFAHHVYGHVSLAALVEALLDLARPLGRGDSPSPSPAPRGLVADGAAIAPDDVARAVNDLFARHGRMPIASDMGDCLFTAMDMVLTELVAPGYYATMGSGVPMGLGLQAASGRRPLILVGDGAFQMTGWELGNCRRFGWTPIVLVFNNSAWGMLKAFQSGTGYNDLDDWRFAELATALGGHGTRVTTRAELAQALDHAVTATDSFQLIEIILPRDALSATLRRFTTAMKEKSVLKGG